MPGGEDLPLVKIRIPVKRVEGYVQMLGGIRPVIPPGAIVHLKIRRQQHGSSCSNPRCRGR